MPSGENFGIVGPDWVDPDPNFRFSELTSAPSTFSDTGGNTFEADIAALAAAGVTRGCNPPSNTRFCPNDFATRGQMAAFLHRALGS